MVVVVEDAVAMVGSGGGSGSGVVVALVVPSVVVVESVVTDRLAPRRRNVCLDKKLTLAMTFCTKDPTLSPSIYYF